MGEGSGYRETVLPFVLFSFVTKSDLQKKKVWGDHGAVVTGGSPTTGSKAGLWQILADSLQQIPHFKLKEGKCLILQMLSKKPFSSLCVCHCRNKMPCSDPRMLSDNNCILTAAGQTSQRQSSWGAHAFISPPVWDERPHFRAPSCKAQSCPSHWVSCSPWAYPLPPASGLSVPLWAGCGGMMVNKNTESVWLWWQLVQHLFVNWQILAKSACEGGICDSQAANSL